MGPILLANWYRPPGSDVKFIREFGMHFDKLSVDHVACIVCGYMNVHNREWLRYSSGTCTELA